MQDDRRRLRADPPSIPDIEPMQDDSSRLMADQPSIPDIEMEDVLLEEIAPEDLDNYASLERSVPQVRGSRTRIARCGWLFQRNLDVLSLHFVPVLLEWVRLAIT